jgi:hypothetical protein
MIGTSTNLVVEGLAVDAGEKPIGFFEPAYVAGPAGDLPPVTRHNTSSLYQTQCCMFAAQVCTCTHLCSP